MHITLEADYAVRIVDAIARNGGRMTAAAIAERAYVTQKFTVRILFKLTRAKLVLTYRGVSGGYEIAKPLDQITVYDVLRVIEGPIVLNRCLLEENTCTRVPDKECPYHYVFQELSDHICNKLISITFADVIKADK